MASITDNVTKVNFVNGSTTTTDLDLVKVNLNGTIYYKYVKAYTYNKNVNYTRPGYDWDFRCYRSSSPYKGASTGQISDGGTIYYGDVIYFTVNSDLQNAGITLSTSKPQSSPLTVTGNVNASSYISIVKAAGRVWLVGYGDADPTAITSVYVRVDNGNWVLYNNLPYDDVSVTVQETIYFDSAIDIYDVVNTGYTAQYTQSNYKRIMMEREYQYIDADGNYNYIYQAKPATCTFQFVKNTGVNKIYYRNSTSGNWTELSSTTNVSFAFGTTVQWYATNTTGYTRNDNYTSSSNYQTITVSVKQTISPTATLNTYAVSVSKGTGIDRIYYKTSSSGSYSYTTSNLSLTLNHGTYFAWYATPSTGYNVTSAYTSSNPYTNSGVTSALSFSATASLKTYTLTITKNTGVDTIYYKVNGASSWSSTTSSKTVSVNYGSNIYWYATASSNYTRDDSYTSSSNYATISSVTSNKTISPTASINEYAVNFTLGSYVTSAFTSTNANATSGNASGTTYDYGTTVYYFVVKNADTTQYTYTCSGTHISGNVYRLGNVTVNGTKNLGALSSVTRTTNKITYTIYVAAIDSSMIAPYYICSDGEDYDMMVAPGGLGNHVIKQFTVSVKRAANLTEVYLSQSAIQQKLPGSYVYTGGTITFTADPDNPYFYVGVYVYDDDH